jgi:primary-amine oxidase
VVEALSGSTVQAPGTINASLGVVVAVTMLAATGPGLQAQTPVHPLDQLSAKEHWVIYDALQASGKLDSTFRLLYEGLKEPAKSAVLAWQPGQPLAREAPVHLTQGKFGYEAVVDITGKKLLSWTQLPGKQFMTSGPESEAAGDIAMKDPRVKAALRQRGVTDFTHVSCSPANNGNSSADCLTVQLLQSLHLRQLCL